MLRHVIFPLCLLAGTIIYTLAVLRLGYAWGDREKDARRDSRARPRLLPGLTGVMRRPLSLRC